MPGSYPSHPKQRRGRPIKARTLNESARANENLSRITLTPGSRQSTVGGIPLLAAASVGNPGIKLARTPVGGISARNGTTGAYGSATCTLYNDDGTAVTLSSDTVTIYNKLGVAVGASKDIWYTADEFGNLFYLNEVCA